MLMKYDVIVIGGGPSGMLGAISAKKHGAEVLLIEKNKSLGRKMLISGGGRCNLSNISSIDDIINNIPGNGKFLYSTFKQFSNVDLITFFEQDLGIKTKVEDRGRVFPATDKSTTLIEAIDKYLNKIGVHKQMDTAVKEIIVNSNHILGVRLSDNNIIKAKSIVLATGGQSYPNTGSTGDGYRFAKQLGHTITDLFPASVALNSNHFLVREKILQGVSLKNIQVSLYDTNGKVVKSEEGDMIFTHFGVSGPAVLRISRYVTLLQKKIGPKPLKLVIDLFPDKNEKNILDMLNDIIKQKPKKILINGLNGILSEKILSAIFLNNDTLKSKKMGELSRKELQTLVKQLKYFELQITGPRSLNEAIVTGGGISIKEIDPKSLSSKIIKGLYIVGEVLDIDAYTGGYNMQAAFSTGYVAGKWASVHSLNAEG